MADEAQSETVEVPENTNGKKTRTLPEEAKPFMWKPGESGNPGGRPRRKPLSDAYAALLNEPVPEAEAAKLKLKPGATYADIIAMSLMREAIKGKVPAASEMADRIEGRAIQTQEISGPAGGPLEVSLAASISQARKRVGIE